jgi:hypothetical protein
MNLQSYYRKIREAEAVIDEAVVLTVSLATDDGGMPGIRSEVTRALAAKLIVENRVRLATPEETAEHKAEQRERRRQVAEQEASNRLQVAILSDRQVENFILKDKKKG